MAITTFRINKKLGYRWQTPRRICAVCNGVAESLKHSPPAFMLPFRLRSF